MTEDAVTLAFICVPGFLRALNPMPPSLPINLNDNQGSGTRFEIANPLAISLLFLWSNSAISSLMLDISNYMQPNIDRRYVKTCIYFQWRYFRRREVLQIAAFRFWGMNFSNGGNFFNIHCLNRARLGTFLFCWVAFHYMWNHPWQLFSYFKFLTAKTDQTRKF